MSWVQIRARSDPAFWVPLVFCGLFAVILFFAVDAWFSQYLDHLRALASVGSQTATRETVRTVRIATWAFCALMVGFSALMARYFQLGQRQSRLPPAGWWSVGSFRILTGAKVRRMSRLGLLLSAVLLVATVGLALTVERLIRLVGAAA